METLCLIFGDLGTVLVNFLKGTYLHMRWVYSLSAMITCCANCLLLMQSQVDRMTYLFMYMYILGFNTHELPVLARPNRG